MGQVFRHAVLGEGEQLAVKRLEVKHSVVQVMVEHGGNAFGSLVACDLVFTFVFENPQQRQEDWFLDVLYVFAVGTDLSQQVAALVSKEHAGASQVGTRDTWRRWEGREAVNERFDRLAGHVGLLPQTEDALVQFRDLRLPLAVA